MRSRRNITVVAGVALLGIVLWGIYSWQRYRNDALLVSAEPTAILGRPSLLAIAIDQGRPLYAQHCAACHGAALQGDAARGVPNLAANAWAYGNDPVEVEHTILYGIRSGHPKARNVTDMPALVRIGQITADEARDAAEYLESLAGERHDEAMAQRGRRVYFTTGNCFDCHAPDAHGISDYGSPPLTGPRWLYGGDRQTLLDSIRDGRHGICPAWIDKLTPLQIRALTLYLVSATHTPASTVRPRPGDRIGH
jgi:cytochrome c oxidase cbb3-type subunit III